MRQFSSFGDLAAYLRRVARAVPRETEAALHRIGNRVETVAKGKIGHYQEGIFPGEGADPFPAWAELAPSTIDEKTRLGYAPPDNPLLRRGELRDSIGHEVGGTYTAERVTLGSTSPIMPYHEHGTDKMPPRPVIGAAMAQEMPENMTDLQRAIANAFEKTN
jgi:hypothetical protein